MTEQEIIDAVTTKLTGEFYVGQRVRYKAANKMGVVGTLEDITPHWHVVRLDTDVHGRQLLRSYLPTEIEPI
jgi:hypothetical protein